MPSVSIPKLLDPFLNWLRPPTNNQNESTTPTTNQAQPADVSGTGGSTEPNPALEMYAEDTVDPILDVSTNNGGTVNSGVSVTERDGDEAITDSSAVAVSRDGTVAINDTNSTKNSTTGEAESSSNTFSMQADEDSLTANTNFANSQTNTDGETAKQSGGVGAVVDEDGLQQVNANYSQTDYDGTKFGIGGNIRRDGFGGNISTGGKNWGVGFNFDVVNNRIEQTENPTGGDTTASLFGENAQYISTTRTDSLTLGGNASFRALSLQGSVNSGSSTEIIQAMDPAVWEGMSEAEREAVLANQQAALANYTDGIAGVDLLSMSAGTGVHVQSFNGWNAGGGLALGAVGVNGGIGQTTAHDVTIVRPTDPNAPIMVNVGTTEGLSVEAGLEIMGAGLGVENENTRTRQTQFSIDPAMMELDAQGNPLHPETYEAVQMFLQTGLMPGAANMQDPAAQTAYEQFSTARERVDTLGNDITAAQERLAQNPNDPMVQAELTQLLGDLDDAQSTIDINRNYLNGQWEDTNAAGAEPVEGVVVQGRDDNQTSEFSANVAGFEVGSITETWMAREYWSEAGTREERYGYEHQNVFLNYVINDFSTASDTNTSDVMLGMHSNTPIDRNDAEMVALAAGIDNGTAAADFMVNDPNFLANNSLALTVEFNDAQMQAMSNSLNNMDNPESAEMWAHFGEVTSAFAGGGQWWEAISDDQAIMGQDHYNQSRDFVRNDWLESAYNNEDGGPITDALHAFGGTQEEAMAAAAQTFAGVNNPEAFQALTPEQQQLFIAIIDQTSGEEDFSGQHNNYEAIACISLIEDEGSRAQSMNQLVADNNDIYDSHFNDAGWDFLRFAQDRFADSDPATYAILEDGMSLDFSNQELDRFEGQSTEEINRAITDAYNFHHFGHWDADPQEDTIVNGMIALMERQDPNAEPGAAMTAMITATGMDPMVALAAIPADKPALRQMFIDMMMQTEYADDIQALEHPPGDNQTSA